MAVVVGIGLAEVIRLDADPDAGQRIAVHVGYRAADGVGRRHGHVDVGDIGSVERDYRGAALVERVARSGVPDRLIVVGIGEGNPIRPRSQAGDAVGAVSIRRSARASIPGRSAVDVDIEVGERSTFRVGYLAADAVPERQFDVDAGLAVGHRHRACRCRIGSETRAGPVAAGIAADAPEMQRVGAGSEPGNRVAAVRSACRFAPNSVVRCVDLDAGQGSATGTGHGSADRVSEGQLHVDAAEVARPNRDAERVRIEVRGEPGRRVEAARVDGAPLGEDEIGRAGGDVADRVVPVGRGDRARAALAVAVPGRQAGAHIHAGGRDPAWTGDRAADGDRVGQDDVDAGDFCGPDGDVACLVAIAHVSGGAVDAEWMRRGAVEGDVVASGRKTRDGVAAERIGRGLEVTAAAARAGERRVTGADDDPFKPRTVRVGDPAADGGASGHLDFRAGRERHCGEGPGVRPTRRIAGAAPRGIATVVDMVVVVDADLVVAGRKCEQRKSAVGEGLGPAEAGGPINGAGIHFDAAEGGVAGIRHAAVDRVAERQREVDSGCVGANGNGSRRSRGGGVARCRVPAFGVGTGREMVDHHVVRTGGESADRVRAVARGSRVPDAGRSGSRGAGEHADVAGLNAAGPRDLAADAVGGGSRSHRCRRIGGGSGARTVRGRHGE